MAGSSQARPILPLAGLAIVILALVAWSMAWDEGQGLQPLPGSSSEDGGLTVMGDSKVNENNGRTDLSKAIQAAEAVAKQTEELPPHAITLQLEGRITDAHSGEAIPDAKVMISDSIPESGVFDQAAKLTAPAPFVLSDQQGYYAIQSVLSKSRTQTYAWHPEYIVAEKIVQNRSRSAGGSGPAVDFALVPRGKGAGLIGRVVDERAQGIAGVEILISDVDAARLDLARRRLAYSGHSEAGGKFEILDLPPGEYVLFALGNHYEDYQRIGIELPAGSNTDLGSITLRSFPWAKLSGRVLERSGEAIANMKVALQQSLGEVSRLSDENGAFSLDRVAPGTWSLWLTGDDRPSYTERLNIEPRANTEKEINLPGGTHFIGGTLLIAGKAAAGFDVKCGPGMNSEMGPWIQWSTKTDASGRFRIDGLPLGKVDLSFSKELPWTSYGQEGVEIDRDDHVFDFETHGRHVSIHGFVRDELGAPLAGARIASFLPQTAEARGLSAADGSYRIQVELSYDSSFAFFAELAPYRSQRKQVRTARASAANEIELDFVLQRELLGGIVGGRVADARGRGIPKVNVVCLAGPDEEANAAWTDSEGRYRFRGVVPGKLSLHFRVKGYLPAIAEGELAVGERLEIDQVLGDQPRHARRVQVLGVDDNPIANVEVDVWDDRKAFIVSRPTDVHGEAKLPGLPSGKISFSVELEGYSRHELEYELDGESDQPVILRLLQGTEEIRGMVVNASGDPLIGMQVDLIGSDATPGIRAFAYTDDKGEFHFTHLPRGEYALECWTVEGTAKSTAKSGGPATTMVIK